MQAFFIQLNVCCSCYYRLLQVWYYYQPTDLNIFKSHTKPGKRKKIKLFFTQQHQLSILSRQGKDKYMCPEAQDLESCPRQTCETIAIFQKKKKKSGNISGSECSVTIIQGSFPFEK